MRQELAWAIADLKYLFSGEIHVCRNISAEIVVADDGRQQHRHPRRGRVLHLGDDGELGTGLRLFIDGVH